MHCVMAMDLWLLIVPNWSLDKVTREQARVHLFKWETCTFTAEELQALKCLTPCSLRSTVLAMRLKDDSSRCKK